MLFPDGYEETEYLHLYESGPEHTLNELAKIQLLTPDGHPLSTHRKMIAARHDVVLILDESSLYQIKIDE